MAKYKQLLGILFLVGFTASCDLSIPDKPDFKTAQTVEVPLINNKTYVFLGDSTGALIDTTSEDLDSLFIVDPSSGLISITADEEFDFGDLDDAIPEIDGSNTSFSSEVGEIEIGDFASGNGGNLGEASFAALTGTVLSPSSGDPVPPQPAIVPEVTIDLETDFFQSATFKSGSLEIVISNDLGFNLSNINVTLVSAPDVGPTVDVVSSTSGPVVDEASGTISLPFNANDELANPQVRVSIEWPNGQTFQRDPNALIVNSASGNNLLASSVTANLEPQDFSTTSTSTFSDTEFRFTDPLHFVELNSGQISITNFVNNMGIGIESLQISFPGIRTSADLADSLVIAYPGGISANMSAPDRIIDLSGYRIYAENNEVSYNIVSATENTQTGPNAGAVTIAETDEITATVDISGLGIESAFGIVLAQNVLLGDNDVTNDTGIEILDVFNDNEAELTSIDGLDELSDQIDGFLFTNPIININYNSNIGIETTIYAALVGVDGQGNEVFLTGKEINGVAGPNMVVEADRPSFTGLVANGRQLEPEELIKFSIDDESDCVNNTCQISFNINTTNVDKFLNNLPSDIRFVGRAVVNQSESVATIRTPLEFDPNLNVDLPLAFSTEVGAPASFTDTLEFSVDPGDDLEEGSIFIVYSNNLPMGLNIFLSFQDEFENELFALPIAGEEIRLRAAPVDDVTGFSNASTDDSFQFTLTESELSLLKDVENIEFSVNLRSSENKAVKLRANDSFTISLGARIKIQTEVKGK
jgi:hypothetical protein